MRKKDHARKGLSFLLAVSMIMTNLAPSYTVFASESVFETDAETEKAAEAADTQSRSEIVEVDVPESSYSGPSGMAGVTGSGSSAEVAVTETAVMHTVAIDIGSLDGYVSVRENGKAEKNIRIIKDEDGELLTRVTDKDGTVISESALAQDAYALVLTEPAGSVTEVRAVADDGYAVALYSVTIDSGAAEKIDFEPDLYSSYTYNIAADADKAVSVYFGEVEDDIEIKASNVTSEEETEDPWEGLTLTQTENEETAAEPDTEAADIVIETDAAETDAVELETEALEEEILLDDLSDLLPAETELSAEETETGLLLIETESETSAFETELMTEAESEEAVFEEETEEALELESETEAETEETEHFLEKADGVENLNRSDFESMRLVVMASYYGDIIDPEHLVSSYGSIHLLQYNSVEQSMNAYMYYQANAEAVEPDHEIEVAQEADTGADEITWGESEDPISALTDLPDYSQQTHVGGLIALIDTGASGSRVIGQVSLIDDAMTGNGHGSHMAEIISGVDEYADILSIRAMDDNGIGTVSSVVAAIEYAIDSGADIINLSIYAKKTLLTSVVVEEIEKAVSMGIIVVGAAGNDGANASGYVPGCVGSAYIIGACDEKGQRIASSNYGSVVDYYAVAGTTSEAAATFTGHISFYGIDNILVDMAGGRIFTPSYVPPVEDPDRLPVIGVTYDFYDIDDMPVVSGEDLTIAVKTVFVQALAKEGDYYTFKVNLYQGEMDVDAVLPHGVCINPGQPENVFITEECPYDADTGIVKIPVRYFEGEYEEQPITFGISATNASPAYRDMIPDDEKIASTPDEFMIAGPSGTWKNTDITLDKKVADLVNGCSNAERDPVKTSDARILDVKKGDLFHISGTYKYNSDTNGHRQWKLTIKNAVGATGALKDQKVTFLNKWLYAVCINYLDGAGPGWSSGKFIEANSIARVIKVWNEKGVRYVRFWIGCQVKHSQNQGGYLTVKYNPKSPSPATFTKVCDPAWVPYTMLQSPDGEVYVNPLYDDLSSSYIIKKKSDNGYVTTITSDETGEFGEVSLAAGDYYAVEDVAPPNYIKDTSQHHFTVVAGKTTEVVLPDVPLFGNTVNLQKANYLSVGSTGLPHNVDGEDFTTARFKLQYWPINGGIMGEPAVTWYDIIPAYGGQVQLNGPLPVGTYRLVETQVPAGFPAEAAITEASNCLLFINTVDQEKGTVLDTWNDENLNKGIVYNGKNYGGFSIHKRDYQGDEPTGDTNHAGIQFAIYNANANPAVIKSEENLGIEYAPGNEMLRITTDAKGDAAIGAELGAGGYYDVYEVESNGTMNIDTGFVFKVYIDTDGIPHYLDAAYNELQAGGTFQVNNSPVRGGLELAKKDILTGSTTPSIPDMSGAVFNIINISNNAVFSPAGVKAETAKGLIAGKEITWDLLHEIASGSDGKNYVAATIVSGTDSMARTGPSDLTYGRYIVYEESSPTVYMINKDYHPIVDIDSANTYKTAPDCEETPVRGGIRIQKFDFMRDTVLPHGDADLNGAQFRIVNANTFDAIKAEDPYVKGSPVVKETVPGASLPDSGVVYQQVANAPAESTMYTLTTDANGNITTSDEALSYGRYYVIETEAPAGYELNTSWVGTVFIEENKVYDCESVTGRIDPESNHAENAGHDVSGVGVTGADGHDYAMYDQIKRGSIQIVKHDLEMDSATAQGMAKLKDAEFTIVNASAASIRNTDDKDVATAKAYVSAAPGWDELSAVIKEHPECVVDTILTNAQGIAKMTNKALPYGTYYVIETKASEGMWLDDSFIGKVVIRDDGVQLSVGSEESASSFTNINAANSHSKDSVDQQVRRHDIYFQKNNLDGSPKAYIPFMITAIRRNSDGTNRVIEKHIIVSDAEGNVNTSTVDPFTRNPVRKRTDAAGNALDTLNGFDQYIDAYGKVTEEGEKHLKEASDWGIWFEGNASDYPKNSVNDEYGALYPCLYKIEELRCNANAEENLVASVVIDLCEDCRDEESLRAKMVTNNRMKKVNSLNDNPVRPESEFLDTDSGSKTVPALSEVSVTDTVVFTNVTAGHRYRMRTKVVDITDNFRPVQLTGPDMEGVTISDDGTWAIKEFAPEKDGKLNTVKSTQSISMLINTEGLKGHTLMAVDELDEMISEQQVSDAVTIDGDWQMISRHPDIMQYEIDWNQCVYVPDLCTKARNKATSLTEGDRDRVGDTSDKETVLDTVSCMNLSPGEQYKITMTVKDSATGKVIGRIDAEGSDADKVTSEPFLEIKSALHGDTVYSKQIDMPDYVFDASGFTNGESAVVCETLWRLNGKGIFEPILEHDSLLDEDQTIRFPMIRTSASDKNTGDDVGTGMDTTTIKDIVRISNVIFDDDDITGDHAYTVKGSLVYQTDFTDADGVEHKAGDKVATLEGTKDTVNFKGSADGKAVFTYPDGTTATGKVISIEHGYSREFGEDYKTDTAASYATVQIEMSYVVDSGALEGGSVVVFEDLYHDSTGGSTILVAKHNDLKDKDQTVHFPKVGTSAAVNSTGDDVGEVKEMTAITDTVHLTNLVPGRQYTVSGILKDQDTGEDFLAEGKTVVQSATFTVTVTGETAELVTEGGENWTVTSYDAENNFVNGTIDLVFTFNSSALEDKTCVAFEDLSHNGRKVAVHRDLSDDGQTVHIPKIRTTAADGYTKDHVGTVTKTETLVDTVLYSNLIPGRTYTASGVLMNRDTGDKLLDADGKEVTAEREFVAGTDDEANGLRVTDRDDDKKRVSGSVDITFTFDGSLLEGTTVVAFEDLYHNGINVTSHASISDEPQAVHYPKLETTAIDGEVGDEVGMVDKTIIRDEVSFTNLVPGNTYEVKGTLMNQDTNEPILVDGEKVTAYADLTVNEDGTVSSDTEGADPEVAKYDKQNNSVDGTITLVFELDASALEGATTVVFEDLYHNNIKVTAHADINDQAQTIHFPKIRTTAVDSETGDHAGTVTEMIQVEDLVHYSNLVIGRTYTIRGTLMDQESEKPVLNPEDGTPVTAEATFVATTESSEVNTVNEIDEKNHCVSGDYLIVFNVDSRQLAGKTVVAFEDLEHNNKRVTTHSDITDEPQSVHYPDIHTTATDVNTEDHVGSIYGALMNRVRKLLGKEEVEYATVVDTVELDNLVPGYTYVVSGKLYNVDESHISGEDVPLVIDGNEITNAVTITVSEDGVITAADGSKTTTERYDKEHNRVDGTVDVTFRLDSSKIQGVKLVVFEKLYHDKSYTKDIDPKSVDEKDLIHEHTDIDDEGQSISEVAIRTTAVDAETKDHVGSVPGSASTVSVIKDEVNLKRLVPGMKYTIRGVLVDLDKTDLENEKAWYLAKDGTLTDKLEKAYTQEYTFTAKTESEIHYVIFELDFDKVQGRTLTVFEDLLHNGEVITSHPSEDEDGWKMEDFKAQTVYYPTGKTNATDNINGNHTSYADETRIITDRVFFENLLMDHTYEISGNLVYQSDFTDSDGVSHKAGEALAGEGRSVRFRTSESLAYAEYVDGVEYEGTSPKAVVDSLKVHTLPTGEKTVSGYVSIEFKIDAHALEGATLVAFEEFSHNGVKVFTHADLKDLPQTIRIPKIRTSASSLDLDEAAAFNADGTYRDIEIIDTVTYEALWTKADFAKMTEEGKDIIYKDGSAMGHAGVIYDIAEDATYVLTGTLMDKKTGRPLTDASGKAYTVTSDPFSPEKNNGSYKIRFVVNAKDFVKNGESELIGKTVVVFEDLFMTNSKDKTSDKNRVAVHHDINDNEQDIRFPKGRTHANDAKTIKKVDHVDEQVTTMHEVFAGTDISITDEVSFENLHGATTYKVTGKLMVVTGFDENGIPNAYAPATDDNGSEITARADLDTAALSKDYNDSVSGTVTLTFNFSGVKLAGKTTVAFETVERAGVPVIVHADIKDEAQTIYIPKIHTNASDVISGLDETIAGAGTVIIDKISYENLEAGKTYHVSSALYRKDNGAAIDGAVCEGTFVAGVDDQFITRSGTQVSDIATIRKYVQSGSVKSEIVSGSAAGILGNDGDMQDRVSGEVYVLIPVDTTNLKGATLVAFETLFAQEDKDNWKKVAEHCDINDGEQSVKVPSIGTKATVNGKKSVTAGTKATVVDTVEYKNLTPGRRYIMSGELVNKADGKTTKILAQKSFTPKKPNGKVEVEFKFDSSKYAGCELVVFEELEALDDDVERTFDNDSQKTWKVAEHKDINDKAQTVSILKGSGEGSIKTGDYFNTTALLIALLCIAALLGTMFIRRRRNAA